MMIRPIGRVGKRFGRVGKRQERAARPLLQEFGSDLPDVSTVRDLEDPQIKELRRKLGDDPQTERLIKRLVALRQREPLASLPELIAYDWLERKQIPFEYQGSAFGGRIFRGGQVPDFVLPQGGQALCWRIQGEYWHSQPGAKERDLAAKLRLLGGTIEGMRVWAVVDVWEDDVYERREQVFRLALAGIGLRD